jgi:hypothetical protein
MFLTHKATDVLVEVMDLSELFNPCCSEITGREHAGEEMQDPTTFLKTELVFPSGEVLPRCWLDRHYRDSLRSSRLSDRQLTSA